MESAELLQALVDMAGDAGLQVRKVSGRGLESELQTESGVCRVGDSHWVVLASSDPLERRIDVVAGALREHAGDWLGSRYLPPAIRQRVGVA